MPNTLTQLNTFSNSGVIYEDQRPYSITFNPNSPSNPSVAVNEDVAFQSPVGTNIVGIVSAPSPQTYNIDLSSFGSNASLTWSALPTGVSILNPGGNVYSVTGYFSPETWDQVKGPMIRVKDQGTNFSYTANIQYPDPANVANVAVKSWTVNAVVTASEELSNASDWSYVKNETGTIVGAPQIIDAYSGPGAYTVTVTPSTTAAVNILSALGTGADISFNPVTKVLTITGEKAGVNNRLAAIRFTPATDSIQSVVLTYTLVNPISGLSTSKTQNITALEAAFNIGLSSYSEDAGAALQYSVVDQSATATNFTIQVAQSVPDSAVRKGYFHLNGSNVGNTVSWSGTKTQVNTANVWYFPPVDWEANISLSVNQSKIDNGNTVIQHTNDTWVLTNSATNSEIVNMINRSYASNTVANIFATSTPAIQDGTDFGQLYTITLTSSLGKFGNSAANAIAAASYTFTGNRTQVNSEFSNMKFVPNLGTSSSGTFTYTQTRDQYLQVNQTLSLTGTVQAITPTTFTYSDSGTFTPTFDQAYYGTTNAVLIGGGGAGVYARTYSDGGLTYTADLITGGGGAGQFRQINNISLTGNQAYPIVIGQGGRSGNTTAVPQDNYDQIIAGRTPGGNTTAFGFQSNGGQTSISNREWAAANPGQTMPNNGTLLVAGNEGSGTYQGGAAFRTINNGTRWAMGGGAGASGNGGNASSQQQTPPLSPIGIPGTAGPGISYNGTTYCVGGPGNTTGGSTTAGSGGVGSGTYGTTTFPSSLFANGQNGLVIISIS